MPIKSVEQKIIDRGVLGNFPRAGKLRKGAEKTERGAGRDQDHFRLTLETPYEHIRPAFEALYGNQPQEFHNVLMAADSPEQAFQYWNEQWAHARLLKRCDEETIVLHWEENGIKPDYSTEPLACTCDPLKRDCKQHGRLDIVLPELYQATGEWVKFTVETTSIYDVIALRSYMTMAEAFMQKLTGVAFWSVPFTIGRAMRDVPVTINGKRSIKAMSLLFVKIEPEFNQQVFTPMLMRPAQLLLAGVNPETGELPIEAEFNSAQEWDRDYVKAETIHLFDHDNHWDNAIFKMVSDGEILDDMTDEQVVQTIAENRMRREIEKNTAKTNEKGSNSSAAQSPVDNDLEWALDAKTAGKFIAQANQKLGLDMSAVMEALLYISVDPIQHVQEFVGTKADAWAACIAQRCGHDAGQVEAFLPGDANAEVRENVLRILKLSEIPF